VDWKTNFCLACQQAGCNKGNKSKPKKPKISKLVLVEIQQWASNEPRKVALADLIWLAFFFLLCLGKCAWTNLEPHPSLLEARCDF
jgi:hypothetical protein